MGPRVRAEGDNEPVTAKDYGIRVLLQVLTAGELILPHEMIDGFTAASRGVADELCSNAGPCFAAWPKSTRCAHPINTFWPKLLTEVFGPLQVHDLCSGLGVWLMVFACMLLAFEPVLPLHAVP